MSEPMRVARPADDLDAQFGDIVDALRLEVRNLRKQVEKYGGTYQKHAEDRRRHTTNGELDEETQRDYRRLKQLQLVVQHIESSAAYLLGSGIDPSSSAEDESVEVAQRVLGSLEAERERLYRDVHDGPAQVLANAIFEVEYLERIAERAPAEVRQTLRTELSNLKGQFRGSLDSVRAMIYDLRPPELTELGLAEAMRNYASEWELRCGIKVGSQLDLKDTGLRPTDELAVYRIMQEALQNVHKHAHGSRINTMGIRQVIEKESDMEIVGVASDGEEAVAKTNELEPDVLVIEVDLPRLSGIKATQRVRRELPAVGVIILTAQDQEQILFEAIRAGAAAYLHKDCEPTELIDAIRKVRGGQFIINEKIFSRPAVASKVLAEFRELSVYGPGSTHVFAPLSPREVQILDNIAQGMTNKEVAYALAISEQTVKNHMSSILRKLSVNDRTQAVVYAIRQGWIKGPEIGN